MRNPRRSRRRVADEMWQPLDTFHVNPSHAGQKPAPAPLLEPSQDPRSPEARAEDEAE